MADDESTGCWFYPSMITNLHSPVGRNLLDRMGNDDDNNNNNNNNNNNADDSSHHEEMKPGVVDGFLEDLSEATAQTLASSCGSAISSFAALSSFDDCLFSTSSMVGNAWDLILTRSSADPTRVAASDAVVCFDRRHGLRSASPHANKSVVLEIETVTGSLLRLPVRGRKIRSPSESHSLYPMEERRTISKGGGLHLLGFSSSSKSSLSSQSSSPSSPPPSGDSHSSLALATIASSLKPGRNRARYLLLDGDGEVLAAAPMSVFSWTDRDRVIVVDVDGTITKSNVRGVVDTVLTESYHHCHTGVCHFFSTLLAQLEAHEFHRTNLVYLSSRPIKLANTTKKFIYELRQKGGSALPDGPLLCFPGTLSKVLKMELVTHSVHEFKHKTLREQVVRPFAEIGVTDKVLLAGFGNQSSDMKAYHKAGCDKIYLIDKHSKICSLDRDLRLRDDASSPPTHPSLAEPKHASHHRHDDDEHHRRSKGLSFEGYSDVNLMDHISHNPHFTHYQDFFC